MKTKHTPEQIALDLLGAHATNDLVKTASTLIRKYQEWDGIYFKLEITGKPDWMSSIKKMLVAYERLGCISFAGQIIEITIACLKRELITIVESDNGYGIYQNLKLTHTCNTPRHIISWLGFMPDIYRYSLLKRKSQPVNLNSLAELAEYLEVDYESYA